MQRSTQMAIRDLSLWCRWQCAWEHSIRYATPTRCFHLSKKHIHTHRQILIYVSCIGYNKGSDKYFLSAALFQSLCYFSSLSLYL